MRQTILIALMTVFAGAGFAQAASAEQQVRAAEKSWAAAVVAGKHAALAPMLSDQLIYAHSNGVIESKADYTGKLRSGAQKYTAIEHQSMTVRIYGDSAVVHSKVRMVGESGKRPFDDQLMMLHVWVRHGGAWQLAAHQTTNLK